MKQLILRALGTVLILLFGIQIVFGVAWLFNNIWTDRGFLGAVLVLVQVMVGFGVIQALFAVLLPKCQKAFTVFTALAALCIPQVMQTFTSHYTNAFAVAAYIMMVTLALGGREDESRKPYRPVAVMGLLWIVSALLMPEYLYIGGILMITGALYKLKGIVNITLCINTFLIVGAFCGILLAGKGLMINAGLVESRENEFSLRLVSRLAWPNLQNNHKDWPEEIKNVMDWDAAGEISQTADGIFEIFDPLFRQTLSADKAQEVYFKLAKCALQIRKKDIAGRMLWDGACYLFSPYLITLQLKGIGYQTYSGRNYEMMKENAPFLTKYYVDFGGICFLGGMIIMLMIMLLSTKEKPKKEEYKKEEYEKKTWQSVVWFVGVNILFMVACFVLRGGGMMDYKLTAFVYVVWISVQSYALQKLKEK